MKILLTGGAGYIGSILTQFLLELGYKVTVIDNFMYRQNSLNHVMHYQNLTIINGDIRDKHLIGKIVKHSDIIIPLAAIVGAPACEKHKHISENVNFDANLEILKQKSKDQLLFMPITNSAYGSGDENNYCNEDSLLNPLSDYATQKVKLEKEMLSFENTFSFRFATVFGFSPKMRFDLLVNDFTYKAFTDNYIVLFEENYKRNYLHVRDAANVFIHAINNIHEFRHQVYNVGLSNANLSKRELCEKIKKFLPNFVIQTSQINKDPDQRNYIVDNSRIEQTGFQCQYSVEDGIQEIIKGLDSITIKLHSNLS